MSTKPCPQCASAVPLAARFCGQCGRTFELEPPAPAPEAARRVPITLDEATGAPAPRPHAGAPTAIGHAAAPVPSPGLGPTASLSPVVPPGPSTSLGPVAPLGPIAPYAPPNEGAASAGRGIATVVGRAVVLDAAGTPQLVPPSQEVTAERGVHVGTPSQAVTAPQAAAGTPSQAVTAPQEAAPAASPMVKTLFDPNPYGATEPAAKPAHGAAALGNTLVLGGVNAADVLPAALLAPPPAAEPPPAMSPLSQSVFAPLSQPPPGPSQPPPGPSQPPPAPVQSAPTARTASAANDKRTMLGMPAVDLPPPPPVPAPQPPPPAQAQPQPQPLPPAMKTIMGVAIPGIAPTHEPTPQAPPPAAGRPLGTLHGVAAPGIAPLHAGSAAQPGQPHRPPLTPSTPPPIVPAPAPLFVEPLPEAPHLPAKRGVSAIVVVAVVFVIVALVGTGAALFIMRAGGVLTAQPQLDEAGKESLKIQCPSCPDGTVIALGAASATVAASAAVLPLPAPLSIGDNDLEMKIDRPAAGRDETVKVHVPVAYRVKADLTSLTSSPAAITVRVEAKPGTTVTVDGKPVALDATGRGFQAIDVSAEVEGPSDDPKTIDKKIPFAITAKKDAPPETGQLAVRASIVPLHLDAPGRELFTDRKVAAVAGQTKPGATVTVDGQSLALDAQGRFGVRVELPADGEKELTIVANAPPLAPRTVRAKVTRVATLDAASRILDAKTPATFDAFGADPGANVGKLVVVDGELLEVRDAQGYTVLLVEEKKACSSPGACIVRVVHGDDLTAARGDSVRAYGRLGGTVSAGGKTVPDIEGAVVLVRRKGKK